MLLLRPIGFGVLLWSGLLEATADVCLWFARQAQLSTYGGFQVGPNLLRVYRTVLGRAMMEMYKEAVWEDENIAMHVEVEEGWKLLLRKDGNTRRYHDALLKDECAYLVEEAILNLV